VCLQFPVWYYYYFICSVKVMFYHLSLSLRFLLPNLCSVKKFNLRFMSSLQIWNEQMMPYDFPQFLSFRKRKGMSISNSGSVVYQYYFLFPFHFSFSRLFCLVTSIQPPSSDNI